MKYNLSNKNGYITRCSLIQTSARGRPHIEPLLTLWTAIKETTPHSNAIKMYQEPQRKGKAQGERRNGS